MDNIFLFFSEAHIKKKTYKVCYTFRASSLEVAALVCNILSSVKVPCAHNFTIDIFDIDSMLFCEWYVENFNRTPREGMILLWNDLSIALKTLLPGDMNDRAKYELAIKYIPDKDKDTFTEEWKNNFAIDANDNIGIHYQRMSRIKQELDTFYLNIAS